MQKSTEAITSLAEHKIVHISRRKCATTYEAIGRQGKHKLEWQEKQRKRE